MTRRQARAAAIQRLAVRRLRRFMASHGYPDPDTIRSERTIWQGANGQIHTSRVCSTSSAGTVVVTSPEIRQIVAEAYARSLHLPQQWSPAQREAFLEAEAAKLSYQVAELAAEMGAQAVGEWTRNRGQHPDYLTSVGLLNTARSQAMEIVLRNELYEQIPSEQDQPSNLWGEDQPVPDRSQLPWEHRWTRPHYRSDPSQDIEAPDLAPVAGPGSLGGVSDQGRIPASGPGRGRPAATERPARSTHDHAGSDGLHRSARRRPTRAVNAQPSLFDEPDQPTDPRSIDPGGAPLPTAAPTPPPPAQQAAAISQAPASTTDLGMPGSSWLSTKVGEPTHAQQKSPSSRAH